MAAATNQQVQNFVDSRVRPVCEKARALQADLNDLIATIDDTYAALTAQSPTWTDSRADAPPHLLLGSDVLAINTFANNIRDAIRDNAQLAIVLKACVRTVGS